MAKSSAKVASSGKGSGQRRRFRGRMVLPTGSPRSHSSGGGSPGNAGFECGSTNFSKAVPTKALPGKYKVGHPSKREHRHGIYRNATTGEVIR